MDFNFKFMANKTFVEQQVNLLIRKKTKTSEQKYRCYSDGVN